MNNLFIRLVAVLLFAFATPINAAFEDLGVSPRATGMGDAFTAIADDAYRRSLQY